MTLFKVLFDSNRTKWSCVLHFSVKKLMMQAWSLLENPARVDCEAWGLIRLQPTKGDTALDILPTLLWWGRLRRRLLCTALFTPRLDWGLGSDWAIPKLSLFGCMLWVVVVLRGESPLHLHLPNRSLKVLGLNWLVFGAVHNPLHLD